MAKGIALRQLGNLIFVTSGGEGSTLHYLASLCYLFFLYKIYRTGDVNIRMTIQIDKVVIVILL